MAALPVTMGECGINIDPRSSQNDSAFSTSLAIYARSHAASAARMALTSLRLARCRDFMLTSAREFLLIRIARVYHLSLDMHWQGPRQPAAIPRSSSGNGNDCREPPVARCWHRKRERPGEDSPRAFSSSLTL